MSPFGLSKDAKLGKLLDEKAFESLKKEWDKNGAIQLVTLDSGTEGTLEGENAAQFQRNYDATALNGKQFVWTDIPAFPVLDLEEPCKGGLVAISMYRTFKVTSKVEGGKELSAVLKMQIELEKVGGKWKTNVAKTDPKLPYTWPR
jgi:hypothetical protein